MPELTLVLCALALAASCVWAQENSTLPPTANDQQASSTDSNKTERHNRPGAARDIGSGAGNIGTGAAKGAPAMRQKAWAKALSI